MKNDIKLVNFLVLIMSQFFFSFRVADKYGKYIGYWKYKIHCEPSQLPFQMPIPTVWKLIELYRFGVWLILMCDVFISLHFVR